MNKIIHQNDLNQVHQAAKESPRLRSNLNVHDSSESSIQRLFITTEPGTYIRPHRHVEEGKWELFVVLDGEIDLLLFDNDGTLTQRETMSPANVRAVQVEQGQWHTYVVKKSNTLAIEVKHGPYIPTTEADFAPWSVPENHQQAKACLAALTELTVGEKLAFNA